MSTEKLRTYLVSEIAIEMRISPRFMEVMVEKYPEMGHTVVRSIVGGLEYPVATVTYPADWWQAFKARWFPEWLRGRFPAEYDERTFTRFCPHKAVLDDQGPHLTFLETGEPAHLAQVIAEEKTGRP